jgi:hypothetical protein
VKRQKKKEASSAAQQGPDQEDEQAISRRLGDVFDAAVVHGDARVAGDASIAKHVAMDRGALSASPDSSRSSGSCSPLWEVVGDDISAPLSYGQGRAVSTITKSPAGPGDQVFGRTAPSTPKNALEIGKN